MEQKRENMIFACTIVGGIADMIGVMIAAISGNVSMMFFAIALLLLIGAVAYLYTELKERKDFIDFVECLVGNERYGGFTLLPKICLAFDKSGEKRTLYAKEMSINCTFDMSNVSLAGLKEDSEISYDDTVEYIFKMENKNVPEEFACYLGNMYADRNPVELSQKHGTQEQYECVPPLPYSADDAQENLAIRRYSWKLNRECITHGTELPVSFQIKHGSVGKAKSESRIIFYPKQYAKRIDEVVVNIRFVCDCAALKKVELFKVGRDARGYKHVPIAQRNAKCGENEIKKMTIYPDATKNEVYYLKVQWDLTSDTHTQQLEEAVGV